MASISEELKDARERRFLLGRICRILTRLESLVNRHRVDVDVRDRQIEFRCMSDEAALEIGVALRIKVELHWVGVYAHREAAVEGDNIVYKFTVFRSRPVRYEDCNVKRQKRRPMSGYRWAKLLFLDDDHATLAEHRYPPEDIKKDDLKKLLWNMAKKTQQDGSKFRSYVFIDPF
jgi:hypothetical protein